MPKLTSSSKYEQHRWHHLKDLFLSFQKIRKSLATWASFSEQLKDHYTIKDLFLRFIKFMPLQMRVFDLSEDGCYRCLLKCDVSKETERMESKKIISGIGEWTNLDLLKVYMLLESVVSTTVSSVASWQQAQDHVIEAPPTVDAGPVILTLQYCTPPHSEMLNSEPSLHSASSVEHMRWMHLRVTLAYCMHIRTRIGRCFRLRPLC